MNIPENKKVVYLHFATGLELVGWLDADKFENSGVIDLYYPLLPVPVSETEFTFQDFIGKTDEKVLRNVNKQQLLADPYEPNEQLVGFFEETINRHTTKIAVPDKKIVVPNVRGRG